MASKKWSPFPHDAKAFRYEGAALAKSWSRLHAGDLEPFPKDAALQEAWRTFHRGDFAEAVKLGEALAADGASVANKAAAVYTTYLEDNDATAIKILKEAAARAERATAEAPKNANAWYFQAFVLGRYAQRVSVMKALAEGVGGKVQKALDTAVKLQPKHADAHIALGLYHAEIIDKVGALAGRLTYGADASKSVKHFEQALKLNPTSAIAHMEYANGLLMLDGKGKQAEAIKLYRKAAACKAADAMEALDIEQAKAELE